MSAPPIMSSTSSAPRSMVLVYCVRSSQVRSMIPGVSSRRLFSLMRYLHPSRAACTKSFAVWYWFVLSAFCACWSSSFSSRHSWLFCRRSLANVILVSTAAPSLVCSRLLMKSIAVSFTFGSSACAVTITS